MNDRMLYRTSFFFLLRGMTKGIPALLAFSLFVAVLLLVSVLRFSLCRLASLLYPQIFLEAGRRRNKRTQRSTFGIFFRTFVPRNNAEQKVAVADTFRLPQRSTQTRNMYSDLSDQQEPSVPLLHIFLGMAIGLLLLPVPSVAQVPCDTCLMAVSVECGLQMTDSVEAVHEIPQEESPMQDVACVDSAVAWADTLTSLFAGSDSLSVAHMMPSLVGGDSLSVAQPGNFRRLIANTKPYRITCVGLPLIAGGLVAMKGDKKFRQLRSDYFPRYKHTADDYLQYSPAVVMLGLKAAGVKGRSSWGRMLVSDVFSAGIMAVLANGLKEGLHVRRPDGSNTRSFPSGHTATAFMAATMLTKEYGYKSKWVGFGAYTVASSVGLMRMANNRHWMSDVMVGAGIGVISTELGYFLTDLIFKEKGLNRPAVEADEFHRWDKPSFLGLRLGGYIPLMDYHLKDGNELEASTGCAGGLEGAYFFNHWIGVGGQFMASNYRILLKDNPSRTSRALAVMAGPYFSWPLTSRCSLGSKLTAGYVSLYSITLPDQRIPHRNGAGFGTGLSCTYKLRQNYLVGLHTDYHLLPPSTAYTGTAQSLLWAGTSFNIIF